MADDSDSIFARAGFDVSKKASGDSAIPPPADAAAPSSGKSLFESAGLRTGPAPAAPKQSWQDIEALENAAALGIQTERPKPASSSWLPTFAQIKAYPAHVVSGLIDTVKYPGEVAASPTLASPEEMVPGALNLAGLATAGDFPRVGAGALTSAALEKAAPSSRAVNALVNAVGPENIPEVTARLKSNPRLALADVSDPVRTITQGLVDPAQPKVQNLVAQTVKQRQATLPSAVNSAYTEAMGPAPNVVTMVEGLKDRASAAGREAIRPALKNAKAVDISPVIAAIDAEVQPGIAAMKSGLPLSPRQQELWRLRNQLADPATGEQLVDPIRLHEIQSQTGAKAFELQKSGDGWTRNVGSGLRDVNEKLVDAIDEASGGTYRPARAKFKDAKDISEAFESGFDTLKNRSGMTGLQDRPEAFAEWMKTATPEEVVARRLGTRSDIDQKIRGVKNQALAGQSITNIEYNQEKLRMLFGDQEANRLIRVMKDAQDEAATNAKLLQGSKTAETLAGREALKVRQVEGGNPLGYAMPVASELLGNYYGVPGLGVLMGGAKGLHLGSQKIGQMMDLARNYQFARHALATGSEREATINALLSHPKVVRALEKRSNALLPPPGP